MIVSNWYQLACFYLVPSDQSTFMNPAPRQNMWSKPSASPYSAIAKRCSAYHQKGYQEWVGNVVFSVRDSGEQSN